MPRELEDRERVGHYQVEEKLSSGGMATSYRARDPRGDFVFLKQYHSPTFIMPWYKEYLEYQEKMKERIEASSFRNFTYRMIEFFEYDARPRCYFQAMEFVDASQSLENRLHNTEAFGGHLTWPQRLTMAKVILAAVKMLHATNIVHADLKPANIILIDNPSSRMGYTLKLIDMDFSLLADQQAPWHGQPGQGYFGTPGYLSPEHLNGEVPIVASDVFTCGIVLYELLTQCGHPYSNPDTYGDDVRSHRAPVPAFLGGLSGGQEPLADLIHRSLSPIVAQRPTAAELHQELIRNGATDEVVPTATPEPIVEAKVADRAPIAEPVAKPISSASSEGRLVLESDTGATSSFGVDCVIGARFARQFGADAHYFSEPQFRLEKRDGDWFVIPDDSATNQTMLNDKPVELPQKLIAGDILAVGNASKGITKMPLTVSFEP